jgi:hypothetical protein
VFRHLVVALLTGRNVEEHDPSFRHITRFMFEFSENPFRDENCTKTARRMFLELSGRHGSEVGRLLGERPRLREKWLKGVLSVVRDEAIVHAIGTPPFIALLSQAMLFAIGTPGVWDCASDREFLDLFLHFIEETDTIVITRDALKVITTKAQARIEGVSQMHAEIFRRLCAPKFFDAFNSALVAQTREANEY